MITWFEAPKEGLSPGGKIEFDTLTATENKTYSEPGKAYTSVTVNVEGGGSSDFSTAEVTVTLSSGNVYIYGAFVDSDNVSCSTRSLSQGTSTNTLILCQGKAFLEVDDGISVSNLSGNIEEVETNFLYLVTGDCSFTIS